MKPKILLFSPVKKPNDIVALHLKSILDLEISDFDFTISFYDDNNDAKSSELLNNFVRDNKNSLLLNELFNIERDFKIRKQRWERDSYQRITIIKDAAIEYFLQNNFDFIFFVDSDLILHPKTIKNLFKEKKDFIAEIFWTHFSYSVSYLPNCWDENGYTLDRMLEFKKPGTYEVGFTGACTLLSRKILSSGVRFEKIKNINWLGEDKHFCTRASVLGFDIFVNTESPAFHIYDDKLLQLGRDFQAKNYSLEYLEIWLDGKWIEKINGWCNSSLNNKSFYKES